MALNKVNLPIARGSQNTLALPANHVTTMSFMQGQPIYYRHAVRGENISIDMRGVVRPIALANPAFADIHCNCRAFYVPYRLVFPQYDAFHSDVIAVNSSSSSLVSKAPYFELGTLHYLFTDVLFFGSGRLISPVASPTTSPRNYDFVLPPDNVGDPNKYYRYTSLGRRFLKILHALGLKMCWGEDTKMQFNCLQLLCYARIYLDWYANSQYLDSNSIITLRKIFAYNDPTTPMALNFSQLKALLELVFVVVYDTDSYFVHAWDNPFSPSSNQQSNFTILDPSVTSLPSPISGSSNLNVQSIGVTNTISGNLTPTTTWKYNNNGSLTPQITGGSVTVYQHDALQKLTNYQKRHSLVGAREIDRVLGDWGFIPKNLQLQRSVYIGNNAISVNIGDVMSHADTSGAGETSNLGTYAGRGFGENNGNYSYQVDEDGMFIIVASMLPSAGMYQGYDRNNRHLDKLDFFTPELDQLGVQLIEKGEVYVSDHYDFITSGSTHYSNGFGFTGRYGEYKRPISWVSGDVAVPSASNEYNSWQLMRQFDDNRFNDTIDDVVHSLDFTRGVDWDQYNRIFSDTLSDYDKFYCYFHFDVTSSAPMEPLFETYDFKEAHKRITTDISGTQLN